MLLFLIEQRWLKKVGKKIIWKNTFLKGSSYITEKLPNALFFKTQTIFFSNQRVGVKGEILLYYCTAEHIPLFFFFTYAVTLLSHWCLQILSWISGAPYSKYSTEGVLQEQWPYLFEKSWKSFICLCKHLVNDNKMLFISNIWSWTAWLKIKSCPNSFSALLRLTNPSLLKQKCLKKNMWVYTPKTPINALWRDFFLSDHT